MKRLVLIAGLTLAATTYAADPPIGWRGDGSGLFPTARPPLRWDGPGATIRWKTETGSSYSSAVVVGERVFVTAEPDLLVCVNRADGKILWKQSTRFSDLPPADRPETPPRPSPTECGLTTPTPVSDGRHVCTVLGSGLVGCYDLTGKRVWVRNLSGGRTPQYGRSASPLIADGKLIVSVSHLQALDLASGKTLWQEERSREGYGSAIAVRLGKETVIITAGGDAIRATDGRLLASGLGSCEKVSPVCRGRVVYFIDAESRAVELPEQAGESLAVKEVWTQDLEGEFFASPVIHDGRIYTVNKRGTLFVLDAATGKPVFEKKLTAPNKSDKAPTYYPSVMLAGPSLFVGHDRGGSLWLRPGKEYAEEARNTLTEGSPGAPAFLGKEIFLRAGGKLYCIAEK